MAVGLSLLFAGVARLWFPATFESPRPLVFPAEAEQQQEVSVILPDVLGLTEEAAKAAFQDAGIPVGEIEVGSVPYAATPGTVVAQQPSAGVALGETDEVIISLAIEATMPDVVGMTREEADLALSPLGVIPGFVEVVTSLDQEGAVLASSPSAGEPITGSVQVEVASAGDAVFLAQLRSTESARAERSEDAVSGGRRFSSAIVLSPSPGRDAVVDYTLSTHGVLLLAQVGTADDGGTGSATVVVSGDGAVLEQVSAARGESVQLRVDVSGVVRLEVTASVADNAADTPRVVLGDARVTGTSTGIDAIVASVGR